MLSELQTLTNNLQIYSVRLISQEQPDFHSDALAGVRANYFRSGGEPQQDKTELELDGRQLRLQYSMQAGKVLSWKITRARQPFQTVKPGGDGYCVIKTPDDAFKQECDAVVNGVGFVPAPLGDKGAHIHRVGDCVAIGNLRTVVWRAWDVCMRI